jgi:outer membrane murein-binding lipoprotein Lpp
MGALMVSALLAIAAANAVIWWRWGHFTKARIDNLTAKVAALIVTQSRTAGERDAARRAFKAAEAEIERLTRSEVTATLHERMGGQP